MFKKKKKDKKYKIQQLKSHCLDIDLKNIKYGSDVRIKLKIKNIQHPLSLFSYWRQLIHYVFESQNMVKDIWNAYMYMYNDCTNF